MNRFFFIMPLVVQTTKKITVSSLAFLMVTSLASAESSKVRIQSCEEIAITSEDGVVDLQSDFQVKENGAKLTVKNEAYVNKSQEEVSTWLEFSNYGLESSMRAPFKTLRLQADYSVVDTMGTAAFLYSGGSAPAVGEEYGRTDLMWYLSSGLKAQKTYTDDGYRGSFANDNGFTATLQAHARKKVSEPFTSKQYYMWCALDKASVFP